MCPAPLLVIGVGNPSRGDDALGPLFVREAEALLAPEIAAGQIELMTDFQLQVEHALDLASRERVVFVDASVAAAPPFELSQVEARTDASTGSHAMSPEAVLAAYRETIGAPPPSFALSIRGERFELGAPLSPTARAHLDAALVRFVADAHMVETAARRFEIQGTVQGVGFRPWVVRTARRLGLAGSVWNTDAAVTIEASGPTAALDSLVVAMQREAPPAARIRSVRVTSIPRISAAGPFAIAASTGTAEARTVPLPPDLAPCAACLGEVDDPESRFHEYAFTSCTDCGPRLAIASDLPYDRAQTSMAGFVPCPSCASEHGDVEDRRFHSQAVACPRCGPRVWLADADLRPIEGDPIALLRDGRILGVQGPSAFHLVCDATRLDVVAELRRRKRRDGKPFAVMVSDLAGAERLGDLDVDARAALTSPARPIVLVPVRPDAPFATAVVNGPSRRVGIMLPYTPLHHVLATRFGRPLVVTSGNPSGGPAVIDHAEARALLGPLVDAFVLHDRPIVRRVEDSVLASSPAGPMIVRRSRGFAPRPIRLPAASPEPILAVGGHMKSAACFVVGDEAILTPHLGDLDTVEAEAAFARDLASFERLLGVSPAVVAHDQHPRYASTRYALGRQARRRIGVQHHLAHVLAVVAEHHIDEPVLGIAYDGTGWGADRTSWGGELFLVDGLRWSRVTSFRPLVLAGGERAIHEVWRLALAALCDAFGHAEALALSARLRVFDAVSRPAIERTVKVIQGEVETVRARGVGRWLDALGALVLGCAHASFDGHVPMALEESAGSEAADSYAIDLPSIETAGEGAPPDTPLPSTAEIDPRPLVRGVVDDLLASRDAAVVAARIHQTIIGATADVASCVLAATGVQKVVLGGGSMQNVLFERGLTGRLGPDRVRVARAVPRNDGGIALGQGWAAVLALASDRA